MVLEEVERGAPAFIDGHNLAVKQRIDWEAFAGAGDTGKLRCEKVTATRPELYATFVLTSQAAIAVEFYFVEPLLALGNVLDGQGIHWLNELDGSDVSSSCFHLKDRRRSEIETNL